jgi:short-subunit dehydrogenase
LVQNNQAFEDFDATFNMIKTNYAGAVSILNIIAMDKTNNNLERIVGLSSLSELEGKSNFIYGSTKSAFTQYLAGLRQELSSRKITVNALVIGYINTK